MVKQLMPAPNQIKPAGSLGLRKIQGMKGLLLKQRPKCIECLTTFWDNSFDVFEVSDASTGPPGKQLFTAKESKGTCWLKYFSPGVRRCISINISHHAPDNPLLDGSVFMHLEKGCSGPFFCWCRPTMKVYLIEPLEDQRSRYMGKIVFPNGQECCNYIISVQKHDPATGEDILKYKIKGYKYSPNFLFGLTYPFDDWQR